MRFSALHKITSYLLCLSGFAALALSGELSPALLFGTLAGALPSFFFEPTRFAFLRASWWNTLWNVTTLLLVTWLAWGALRGEPYLLVGVRFLCYLLVNKLWNRRASRDWLQAYVVSFLMLVAGTTLNTELVFAACFVAYVISATWTLTLFHLRREMEENYLLKHSSGAQSERVEVERILNSRRVVGGAFLAGTSAISASVFVVSALFFFLFPRVGWSVFFNHGRRGLTVGFSDKGVELGGNGLIKDNDQVVMRVEFPPPGEPHSAAREATPLPPPHPLYFRGISFDSYRNGRWTPSDAADRRPLRRWGGMSIVGLPLRARPDAEKIRRRLDGSVRQEVYLEPMDASVLLVAESPVAVGIPPSRPGGPVQPSAEGAFIDDEGTLSTDDVYAAGRQGGLRYSAWSRSEPPPEAELLAAPIAPPATLEALANYLDVDGVPDEVLELGRRITAGAVGPYRKALAVQRYLQRNYKYTLELAHDPAKEPLAEFLFERKQGHCEYFASAMAILLRAAGVPTRHVAGFYGGEWNEVGHYLQIRQRDAHAWVEVYLGPSLSAGATGGWVSMDPTPPSAMAAAPGGLATRLRQMLDVVQLAWFKYVIEYDLTTQMDLLGRLRRAASDLSSERGAHRGLPSLRAARPAIASLLVVGAVAFYVWRRRRSAVAPSRRRLSARAQSALARALRALERRGVAQPPSDTPREVGRRAVEKDDPGAEPFLALVELYYEARYGAREVDEAELDLLARAVVRPPRARPQQPEAN